MTRRARGRDAFRRGLPALGGSCLVASWLALFSCDSRFEFEALTEGEAGADAGGRIGTSGGHGGVGYGGLTGGFNFGNSGSTGSAARGGMGTDGNDACEGRCAAAGLKCKESSKTCVECLEHSHCSPGLSRCSTDPDNEALLNRCVQCLDNQDCGNQICSTFTHTCVSPCDRENQEQCALLFGLECSTFSGFCAGCFSPDDCKDDARGPYCLGKVRCGACADDRDCTEGNANFCDPVLFKCVECRISGDDCKDDKLCDPEEHVCQVTPI